MLLWSYFQFKFEDIGYQQNTYVCMNLKSFDFFRKIQTEQELSSTTGGCFTLFSLVVALILIGLSIQDFTRVEYETSLVIKNDKNQYIPMKLEIQFENAPCEAITLEFHDELEYIESGLEQKLQRGYTTGPSGGLYPYKPPTPDKYLQQLQNSLKEKRKCRLYGTIQLPKTPGTLTFYTQGGRNKYMAQIKDQNLKSQVNAAYWLKKVQFGEAQELFEFPITHYSPKIKQYIEELERDYYRMTYIQEFNTEEYTDKKYNFYNHLKIIPIYVDDGTYTDAVEKQKYRYSLRAGKAVNRQELFPYMQILTELEPINIQYTRSVMTWYDLSVDILAIVGGSVATIGVINALSHFIFGIR